MLNTLIRVNSNNQHLLFFPDMQNYVWRIEEELLLLVYPVPPYTLASLILAWR